MKTRSLILMFLVVFVICACNTKKSKSDIEIIFTQDTLNVGFTYWWAESGPFVGMCGDELSLVFSGVLRDLETTTEDAGPLYTSQKGIIEIEKVLKIKELGENSYANQKFFSSDCFHESGLTVGDTVLVFCYDYEGDYSIAGQESIIKINSFEAAEIASIRKYIDSDQNPIKIKKDIGLWATHGHGRALEDIIACKKEVDGIQ